MNAIIEQARSLDGYQDSSELLQRRDQDWVLDRAGIEPRSLLDLGCGIGSLLLGGARRWPGLQRLWGIERSPLRLEQARAQLRGAGVEARLLEGDLLDLPPLAERFELINLFRTAGAGDAPGGILRPPRADRRAAHAGRRTGQRNPGQCLALPGSGGRGITLCAIGLPRG
ncbi:TPA: class I SAM-dependent methyltransferase [Pseudomonas aeruginosa]|nr:class I SAM-dependent methyltransferase [Pseudomonas aeruginosa]